MSVNLRIVPPASVNVRLTVGGPPGPAGATSWDDLTGKPATFPAEAHSHGIGEVSGLQTALDGKLSSTGANAIAVVASMPGSPDPNTIYVVTG